MDTSTNSRTQLTLKHSLGGVPLNLPFVDICKIFPKFRKKNLESENKFQQLLRNLY